MIISSITCWFVGHDFEKLPLPTNPDYEKVSPGKICIRCGKFIPRKIIVTPSTREEQAAELYDDIIQKKHDRGNYGKSILSPRPLGPYSYLEDLTHPEDD